MRMCLLAQQMVPAALHMKQAVMCLAAADSSSKVLFRGVAAAIDATIPCWLALAELDTVLG